MEHVVAITRERAHAGLVPRPAAPSDVHRLELRLVLVVGVVNVDGVEYAAGREVGMTSPFPIRWLAVGGATSCRARRRTPTLGPREHRPRCRRRHHDTWRAPGAARGPSPVPRDLGPPRLSVISTLGGGVNRSLAGKAVPVLLAASAATHLSLDGGYRCRAGQHQRAFTCGVKGPPSFEPLGRRVRTPVGATVGAHRPHRRDRELRRPTRTCVPRPG